MLSTLIGKLLLAFIFFKSFGISLFLLLAQSSETEVPHFTQRSMFTFPTRYGITIDISDANVKGQIQNFKCLC